jgi:hypothetical protein
MRLKINFESESWLGDEETFTDTTETACLMSKDWPLDDWSWWFNPGARLRTFTGDRSERTSDAVVELQLHQLFSNYDEANLWSQSLSGLAERLQREHQIIHSGFRNLPAKSLNWLVRLLDRCELSAGIRELRRKNRVEEVAELASVLARWLREIIKV